ncbi:hypothetical protein Nans01_13190 [Nocardiopsis ansamitocini]|uniref:Uncharacterized protein n=1 Tax=Nocardiopsis ansamitocini TaxID=1670832 RepID=A0A9W6UI26_9ACTN|nr:hypothetical protein Nans01_13190 [Nocardiopsis ansamitocini]
MNPLTSTAVLDESTVRELNSADVVLIRTHAVHDELFALYPGCLLLVFSLGRTCRVVVRSGGEILLVLPSALHLSAALLVHEQLVAGEKVAGMDSLSLTSAVLRRARLRSKAFD